jgi:hypothetical protein
MKPEMTDAIVWARGVLAARTPGEWRADEEDGEVATDRSVVCDTSACHHDAIVIALTVNTYAPLLVVLEVLRDEADTNVLHAASPRTRRRLPDR